MESQATDSAVLPPLACPLNGIHQTNKRMLIVQFSRPADIPFANKMRSI